MILIFAKFFSSSLIFYCTALRCGIQFLGNLAVGNQMCKDDIWQQSFPNLFLWVLCAPAAPIRSGICVCEGLQALCSEALSIRPCVNRQLLSDEDEKAVCYASMVLHTCLDEAKVEELSKPQNMQVALRVMDLCRTRPDLDWT